MPAFSLTLYWALIYTSVASAIYFSLGVVAALDIGADALQRLRQDAAPIGPAGVATIASAVAHSRQPPTSSLISATWTRISRRVSPLSPTSLTPLPT